MLALLNETPFTTRLAREHLNPPFRQCRHPRDVNERLLSGRRRHSVQRTENEHRVFPERAFRQQDRIDVKTAHEPVDGIGEGLILYVPE
jgi:hypothetical protein